MITTFVFVDVALCLTRPVFAAYLGDLCVVNPENNPNVSHYCDTERGFRRGSVSQRPPLTATNRDLFVSACFPLRCPLLARLLYCSRRWGFGISSAQCLPLWWNVSVQPARILTSMPSDPGVPEGPGRPGWPCGPGGPPWNAHKYVYCHIRSLHVLIS